MLTRWHSTLLLSSLAFLALAVLVACSDDDGVVDEGTLSGESEVCAGLDAVRDDIDDLVAAVEEGDRSGAENAIGEAQTDIAELREDARNSSVSDAVSQSAADLVGAVEGLETTIRQAGQGGGSLTGIIQELEIQLMAIASATRSLSDELDCE